MRSGFSLVELSIVLVILGLLTGGILAGQNLIRAAELRSVTTDLQKYHTAIMTFRDKYFSLPGDMKNATDFWGAADSTPATCYNTVSIGRETCDGDGNGIIRRGSSTDYEMFRAPQHLANAGLIEGSFTGVADTPGVGGAMDGCTIGTNCIESKITNAAYMIREITPEGDITFYPGTNQTGLYFGSISTDHPHGPVLTTQEAWGVDKKMDDGKPASGNVMTYRKGAAAAWVAGSENCADDSDEAVAEYDLGLEGINCALIFYLGR